MFDGSTHISAIGMFSLRKEKTVESGNDSISPLATKTLVWLDLRAVSRLTSMGRGGRGLDCA
eukprot:4430121-Amphidinium_carterae.1